MTIKRILLALASVSALLAAESSAMAAFRLRVEKGTSTGPGIVVTADGTTGASGLSSYITVTDQLITATEISLSSGTSISVSTGTSTPTLVVPDKYDGIDLNSVTIRSDPGTVRLILEQTFTAGKAPDGPLVFATSIGGTLSNASLVFDGYIVGGSSVPDLGADKFPAGTGLGVVTGIGGGGATLISQSFPNPGASKGFSGDASTSFSKSGTYSIYMVVTVDFAAGGGSISFNALAATSPAPGGLLLVLTGMPLIGLKVFLRRRRVAPC